MKKEIEFKAPEGFVVPEDVEPGKPFEAMATLRQKEDGTLCLEAIDGAPLSKDGGDYDKDDAPTDTPPPGFLDSVEAGIPK